MNEIHYRDRLRTLCKGHPIRIGDWLEEKSWWIPVCLAVIVAGSGLYGATIGLWRSPRQGLYVAVKFPLLMLVTTLGTAMLNYMMAQLLGVALSFRQSTRAVLLSFTLASLILGSFSPVTLFFLYNTPPLGSGSTGFAYSLTMVVHVGVIALAGIAANVQLYQLLRFLSNSRRLALHLLLAWLISNLFLGSQLSWITRPFIGSPRLPVEFFRKDAFQGNFYEAVWHSFSKVTTSPKERKRP